MSLKLVIPLQFGPFECLSSRETYCNNLVSEKVFPLVLLILSFVTTMEKGQRFWLFLGHQVAILWANISRAELI